MAAVITVNLLSYSTVISKGRHFSYLFKRNKHFSPWLKLTLNWVGQTCQNYRWQISLCQKVGAIITLLLASLINFHLIMDYWLIWREKSSPSGALLFSMNTKILNKHYPDITKCQFSLYSNTQPEIKAIRIHHLFNYWVANLLKPKYFH